MAVPRSLLILLSKSAFNCLSVKGALQKKLKRAITSPPKNTGNAMPLTRPIAAALFFLKKPACCRFSQYTFFLFLRAVPARPFSFTYSEITNSPASSSNEFWCAYFPRWVIFVLSKLSDHTSA